MAQKYIRYDKKHIEHVIVRHNPGLTPDQKTIDNVAEMTQRFVEERGFEKQIDNFITRTYKHPAPILSIKAKHAKVIVTSQSGPTKETHFLAVISEGAQVLAKIRGKDTNTTPYRMEMTAVVKALQAISPNATVTIVTPTDYIAKAIRSGWTDRWAGNNWTTSANEPVHNRDLWESLLWHINQRKPAETHFAGAEEAPTDK